MNAARDYSEAIRLNPSFNLAHFNMGNLYFHHRQFAQVSVSAKRGGEGAGGRGRVGWV